MTKQHEKCIYCGSYYELKATHCTQCGGPRMVVAQEFVEGVHARPYSAQATDIPAEWDYGGVITAALDTPTWPVVGLDLSYWNGAVDFKKVKERAQFVILRYLYGNAGTDARLAEYHAGASDEGLAIMGYGYLTPDKSWQKHADSFLELLRRYPAVKAWGDIEETGGLGKSALESWLYKYFTRLGAGLASVTPGQEAGAYTSPGFLNAAINQTNWLKNLDLWVATWTSGPAPIIPAEWSAINNPRTWVLWQWSSKGTGADYGVGSRYVDLNRFNGSVAQFNQKFGTDIKALPGTPVEPPAPPPVEPPPVVEGLRMRVSVPVLNVREGPGVQYRDIGDLHGGDEIAVLNVAGAGAWVEYEPGKWACAQLGNAQYLVKV